MREWHSAFAHSQPKVVESEYLYPCRARSEFSSNRLEQRRAHAFRLNRIRECVPCAAKTPRSNCVMNSTKLAATGIKLTEVHEAVERDLRRWVKTV